MTVTDALARPLRDLRISVTDRCNFRRVYCMPREVFGRDYQFLERADLPTFEEIERLARIVIGDHGVSKIRLTGGEPLVRREVERLVERLAGIPGLGDLAMTTNGSALPRKARALKGCRAAPDHGQPRQPRQRGVRRDQRRWLPGRPRAGGDRGRRRGGPRADQDQHGRQARRERGQRGADGPPLPWQPATSCASSNSWTSATATAGGWTRWCRRRRSSR
jgi:hypothetical protein